MPQIEIANLFKEALTESTVETNYELGSKTTYRVGGKSDIYICVNSETDLVKVSELLAGVTLPLLIFGLGSNMLISESGFEGIAISLGPTFTQININQNEVEAGGLSALPVIARQSAKAGLGGFEWAVGVPGSIGGAVKMNAGAHDSDMSECIKSVEILDLASAKIQTLGVNDLIMSYRNSSITPTQLVVKASLLLESTNAEQAEAKIKEIVKWRRKNHPGGQNAGSVFKNPEGISAGQLLDEAGAKNLKVGSASVSYKHANFIQVKPKGNANEVAELMSQMQKMVIEHSGIELQYETIMVNFD